MVDLETLSTKHNAAILSIGATTFLEPAIQSSSFYDKISPSCNAYVSDFEYGSFHTSSLTLDWWGIQEPSIKDEAFSGTKSIEVVITNFAAWVGRLDGEIIIWSYGANFDEPILQNALSYCGIKSPWIYKNVRCFRTLVALYPEILAPEVNNLKHNALADARYQAAWAEKILYTRAGRI